LQQNLQQTCTFVLLLAYGCASASIISLYFTVINHLLTIIYKRRCRAENPCVGGSNPLLPTSFILNPIAAVQSLSPLTLGHSSSYRLRNFYRPAHYQPMTSGLIQSKLLISKKCRFLGAYLGCTDRPMIRTCSECRRLILPCIFCHRTCEVAAFL